VVAENAHSSSTSSSSSSTTGLSSAAADADKSVTFLFKYAVGACPKSYGLNVARLARLPERIIQRAATKSHEFEIAVMEAEQEKEGTIYQPLKGTVLTVNTPLHPNQRPQGSSSGGGIKSKTVMDTDNNEDMSLKVPITFDASSVATSTVGSSSLGRPHGASPEILRKNRLNDLYHMANDAITHGLSSSSSSMDDSSADTLLNNVYELACYLKTSSTHHSQTSHSMNI
jgi:hypothetical protein